ncbi:MAG: hypothetical protein K5886_10015 [Lachnospiraceae bacterium]|nr:hypothetical protein [Lachnospiraceae bacterium]
MSVLKVDKIADRQYTGEEFKPEVTIRDGNTVLTKDTHYTVVGYTDNTLPGTAKIVIKGVEEEGYVGKMTVTFRILAIPIRKTVITGPADCDFSGIKQVPEPVVKYNGTELEKDADYKLIYDRNENAGKARVTISGIGGYTGSVSKTFTIRPADIDTAAITLDGEAPYEYPYVKSGVKPAVTVKLYDIPLKEGKDYTLKFTGNTAITTDSTTKLPTVTITGKGNLKGKKDMTFKITKSPINNCKIVTDVVLYTPRPGNWKTKP